MKNNLKLAALLITLTAIAISSCRKEKEVDNDTSSATENNIAENLFAEVKNISDAAALGYLGSTNYKAMYDTMYFTCATVIHDTSSSPRSLIIDYGNTNCLCGDGKYRRGKIITTYTGPYRSVGTVITHTFDNFHVNDYKIEGTKTVQNMGVNSSNNTYFNINVTGGKITKPTGGVITWESTRVREWIAGESTLFNIFDDEYKITGTASGTRADGLAYSASIGTPLHIKLSCRYIVAGTISIAPSGKPVRTIDYGSGTCDNNATVTVNGNTYNITLW